MADTHTTNRNTSQNTLWEISVKFASQRARKLLEIGGKIEPPFIPEYLASFQGIKKITRENTGELSGLLLPLREGFEIKINSSHSLDRQNFSCAHEIGHTFFFDKYGQALRERFRREIGEKAAIILEERLCDIVASELLMPSSVFYKYAIRYSFSIDSLILLSRIFGVSIVPAALRLCDVNPRENCLVYWIKESSEEITNPRFKMSWLTWSLKKTTIKANRFIKRKLLDSNFGVLTAYNSENPIYIHKRIGIGNYINNYQVVSQGFGNGNDRFVLSFAFPEKM